MSAVAALAVASPFAVIALSELSAPAPQQHEFTQAAMVTDLPNELMSALTQALSQFGINLPPLPTGLSPAGAQPVTGSALTSPALGGTGLGATSLAPTSLTPGLSTPPAALPDATATGLTGTDLTNPALTPATPSVPGLTTPAATGVNPALTSPDPLTSTTGLGLANEQPISAPIGLDPMAGTYPILGGDPSLSTAAPASGGGGLVSDLSSAAQQLGAGQAIDLLKGVLMPTIMSAIQSAAPAAQAAAAAPAAAAPAA
jgi:hypothetical protein